MTLKILQVLENFEIFNIKNKFGALIENGQIWKELFVGFFFLQLMNKCSYGINKAPDGNVSLNPMFWLPTNPRSII